MNEMRALVMTSLGKASQTNDTKALVDLGEEILRPIAALVAALEKAQGKLRNGLGNQPWLSLHVEAACEDIDVALRLTRGEAPIE